MPRNPVDLMARQHRLPTLHSWPGIFLLAQTRYVPVRNQSMRYRYIQTLNARRDGRVKMSQHTATAVQGA